MKAQTRPFRMVAVMRLACCWMTLIGGGCASWRGWSNRPVLSARVRDGVLQVTPANALTVNGEPALPAGTGLVSSVFDRIEARRLAGLRGRDALTLAAWVAPGARPKSYQAVLFRGDRAANPQKVHFSLSLYDGIPEFKYMDADGKWGGVLRNGDHLLRPGNAPVPLHELPTVTQTHWHHVAATFDTGHIEVYLDGKPVAAGQAETAELVPCEAPVMVGSGQTPGGGRAQLFPGLINDVLILNRALSTAEISALYARERDTKRPGAVEVPKSPVAIARERAFETVLPLVDAFLAQPEGSHPDTSAGVCVEGFGKGAVLRVGSTRVYPIAMMPEPYRGDEEITLSCRDFAAAGVHLYSGIFWSWMRPRDGAHSWWLGPGSYDFGRIDDRVEAVLRADPRGLFLPRLKLNPPQWWLDKHPDHVVRYADGKRGPQVSLASREWTALYTRMLRDVIGHMEASPYGDRILGYHPAGGGSSEWFWWGHNKGVIDFSPVAIARWREWLRDKYGTDAALAAAWGKPEAKLAAAVPPPPETRDDGNGPFLRLTPAERPWADYRMFLSDMVSENIVESCRVARESCANRKIAGVFYGYSMYCTDVLGFRGLRRVMRSPHVNFLCSPTSYSARRGGQPGNHISAYNGSMRLHGKLYWDEADNRTHLYVGSVGYRTDTPEETLATLRRTIGHSLTRGTGLWYFLLAGNATFHDQQIMADIARMKTVCDQALEHSRIPAAEVAVFMDEKSMQLYDTRHPMAQDLGKHLLDELAHAGAPFDLYLLSDISDPRLPDYKLYVFPNAFRRDRQLREAIRAKACQGGATVLWVYAPGFADTAGGDTAAMRELTGLRIECLAEGTQAIRLTAADRHPITSELRGDLLFRRALAPVFRVVDPSARTLATGPDGPGLALRRFGDWQSVYSLLPPTRDLLLGLYRYAGVHVYCDSLDVVGASRDYLMIHTASAGRKTLRLPEKCEVTEVITGRQIGRHVRTIRERLPMGVTRIYRLRSSGGGD